MVADFAPSPTHYLGTVATDGTHELYDGKLRWIGHEGQILSDQVDPSNYLEYISERSVDWSYLTYPYYKPLGIDEGIYRVGPLARLNVASRMKTEAAQNEFEIFKAIGNGKPVHGTFLFHYARLIETLGSVEEAALLLDDPRITSSHIRTQGVWNRHEGIGSCEAPRGTLFHHYTTDDDGKLKKINLLIATGQNNPSMNRSITEVARLYVDGNDIREGMLNRVESAIRCYDPCLSCSTHAMGQMPMIVEVRDRNGDIIRRIERN
jgi:NAD-reducing hydrogenase large subunit